MKTKTKTEMTAIKKLTALVDAEPPLWAIGKNQGEFAEFARAALPAMIAFVEATVGLVCTDCGARYINSPLTCPRCKNTGHEPMSPGQEAAMKKLEEALNG